MNRDEEYPSDSDQSDEDYSPLEEPGDAASDADDSDDEKHISGDDAQPKHIARDANVAEKPDTTNIPDNSDALWADFLNDADPLKKPATAVRAEPAADAIRPRSSVMTEQKKKLANEKGDDLFQLLDASSKPRQQLAKSGPIGFSTSCLNAKRPAGLSSVLGQLGKRAKLSTLEKTKQDWNGFKKAEGIDEQLLTHNKGKEGYLERQDFLQRTDVRQFKIEKQLRQTKRSHR